MRRGGTTSPLRIAEATNTQISYECGCAIEPSPEPGADVRVWPCEDPNHYRYLLLAARRGLDAAYMEGQLDVIEMAGHA